MIVEPPRGTTDEAKRPPCWNAAGYLGRCVGQDPPAQPAGFQGHDAHPECEACVHWDRVVR